MLGKDLHQMLVKVFTSNEHKIIPWDKLTVYEQANYIVVAAQLERKRRKNDQDSSGS
jgi:hypothetical protein